MLLTDSLRAVVREHPRANAVTLGARALTFDELWRASGSVAVYLQAKGVRSGERVAILSEHSVAAVVAFWGVLRAGGIVVNVNEQLAPPLIGEILADCEPVLVLAQGRHVARLTTHGTATPAALVALDDDGFATAAAGAAEPAVAAADGDIAAIVYTSGSTGRPKGVCLSHRNLHTVASAVIQHMPISARDSYLMVVPLHYVHGLMQLVVHALAGATVHLAGDFHFPQVIITKLRETRATGFSGVPYHYAALMDRSTFLTAELPDLRWLTVTGGKMAPDQIARLRAARPDLEFHIAYGQTECAPRATALHPSRIDRKPTSVGRPIPGVRVQLLDEAGAEVAAGEPGEVVIAGDNVMVGYWGQPEATAQAVDALGRLHTGDVGRFDEEGDLYIVGRRDNMLKSAGERIYAEELETQLLTCPEVAEAVVVGVPDPVLGQRVEAHLRPHSMPQDATAERDLIDRVRRSVLEKIPFSRAPRVFHVWPELPHKANGKLDRQLLLDHGSRGVPLQP